MIVHRCPGLGTQPLARYLASLGLARVVGEQEDPAIRFGWSGARFAIRSDVPDLVEFLVTRYRPTPVVSPWNGGSGFGEKDKAQRGFVDKLASSSGDRLADFRATIEQTRLLVDDDPRFRGWSKQRQVQELRNWLPDSALAWLDASVVLTDGDPVFPPLLGTGGNDGRLDFSSNFHQRLAIVLPELGADGQASRGWARDLLEGTSNQPLVAAAIGQFDPLAAGGPASSIYGAAENMVNPWLFVLMVEGALWFASAPARRLGEQRGRASMPFCVRSSPDGPIPGAAEEQARGELWAPVFEGATLPQLRQIMSEARASWLGDTAETVPAMYGAVRSFGVDRGIDAFERFGFLQRNGLAFVAAHLDTVQVERAAGVSVAERPLQRAVVFRRAPGAATATAARLFDRAAVAFVRDPTPKRCVDMLVAQTRLENTALRAESNRSELGRVRDLASAPQVLDLLDTVLRQVPEARVAASIASARTRIADRWVTMRDLLVGGDPGATVARPVVTGLGLRPVVDVLVDVLLWLVRHRGDDVRVARGWLPWRAHGYAAQWPDTHAWVIGDLDDTLVGHYLLALLAVQWSDVKPRPRQDSAEGGSAPSIREVRVIDPDLAVLQALASGRVLGVGVSADAEDGRVGLHPSWPARLHAGAVDAVCHEASELLSRSPVQVGPPGRAILRQFRRQRLPAATAAQRNDHVRGQRLLAALAVSADTRAWRRVGVVGDSAQTPTVPAPSAHLDNID